MFKKYILISIFFLSLTSCAQNKVTLFSKANKISPKISIPLTADILVSNAAEDFNKKFKTVTGTTLKIERSNSLNKNYNYILLRVNPTQKDNFCIYRKGGNITLQGSNAQNLMFAISDFFKRYTNLKYQELNTSKEVFTSEIDIPEQFSICSSPEFIYREPYYKPNNNPEFRAWNKTSSLELEWGIWGHNLPKLFKNYNLPESVYAKFGSVRTKKQFCFTSDSLYKYVNENVKRIFDSDHTFNKYMILPNDNEIVCTCSTCKAVGNTSQDAAPAVFTFLNKLAKDNKRATFFTTAYITVKNVPKFKAEDNTGIFYSTINEQKGIPLENTKKFKDFEKRIKKWSDYLKNVYIWDYTVNYDNYFDIYPILKVTQQNLKLYKKLGINGVFLHGSEYDYSTFQDLKSTVFAKLLWNTDINVDQEIERYFNDKYSKRLASILTNYYTHIDNSFFTSNKELSIYSGIDKTVKKYLDPKVFFDFYDEFNTHTQSNKYDKEYLKLATALTFLKLEIMRDYGLGIYGFGTLNNKREIIVKNDAGILLDNLASYSRSADLKTYNERNYKISDYINNWRKTIYKYHKRKHYFYKKKFEVLSKLDEDYTNTKILNDGAFGLNDYNTNWHISSVDDLELKIDKAGVSESKKITFSFLQDVKHHIYYPGSIEILDNNKQIIKKIKLKSDDSNLDTKEVSIELPTKFDDKQLPDSFIVKVKKRNIGGKNALACDEIIFN
ncbi:hypothetical protein BW723_11145 [Polaribacter reichenbachii]|uniref:DUF4838 domain-containing protein n=1 Tax=Polaribacter reichenbachii TaxID=996801 RepID=A0A1B8TPV0_9FLAO|nr:DUF4838 domain-containing protein [Polaribacter reichenbachii]APZ46805.1 hypothetical protein BW723_11145 [Polaribacter reichenbachii]AUC17448.1 hypothetical protein BTO17_01590 [Polaribacter reichenbachii]OBY61677.1 hypothetical protein LPB301_16620 [Polaribacter reichenbachii]